MTVARPLLSGEDARLLEALRTGDEAAFTSLLDRYSGPMLRVALLHVPSRAVAEEVVQEAWVGVLQGLGRFEGRSSLSTWIFRILTNIAKTRGERERRTVPFSSLADELTDARAPSVDQARFVDAPARWPDHWATPPQPFGGGPEERLLAGETRERIRQAVDSLPPVQRTVIALRDIEGWSSHEVCNVLELSETNQRVLVHRARSKLRAALEDYLSGRPET